MKYSPFLLLSLLSLFSSCVSHDIPSSEYDCTNEREISYDTDVHELVVTKCALSGCHNGDLGDDKNWLIFERFQDHASSVRDRITRPAGTTGHMPAAGSLTHEQILTIVCWVEQGAQNN